MLLWLLACADPDVVPTDRTASGDSTSSSTEPCELEVEAVDWMAPGAFDAGWLLHNGTTELRGMEMPLDLLVWYPATEAGQDAAVAAGSFPVVYFEHAYGADYQNSDWLLERLASRGFVVFSAGHNGAWDGAGDWWGDHAALFEATVETSEEWNETGPLAGSMDLSTTALMGHSHGGGAALEAMATIDTDAVVLITVRPSLDGALYRYHEVYDGMPPMLNVVGSRDEDGTTAYGTSVAVYEAVTRPRFNVTVEGASHYTFTDEANINASTIEREDGQVSGGSGIIAFLEYLLHDDVQGLYALRGDAPLFEDGAPVRLQAHPEGEWVIDDFEIVVSDVGTAIAGIDGQTFVNGFLGDTFVDFDAGVALLTGEIEALSGAGDSVLFYQDASRSADAYIVALQALDRDLTVVSDDGEFTDLLAQDWDLIVATQQDGNSTDTRPFDAPLAEAICGGAKAILSDFRTRSDTAAATFACAGVAFADTSNWTRMDSTSDLFSGELRLQNTAWGTFSYGLVTTQAVFATNDVVSEGPSDPSVGPRGAVTAMGMTTFEELEAWDASRALYSPTQALELAWDGDAEVAWALDADATDQALSLRVLQVHDDPLNDGEVDLTLRVTSSDGVSEHAFEVKETADWLPSTTPKSMFETVRFPVSGQVTEVALVASGTGRVLVDDLELTPHCE